MDMKALPWWKSMLLRWKTLLRWESLLLRWKTLLWWESLLWLLPYWESRNSHSHSHIIRNGELSSLQRVHYSIAPFPQVVMLHDRISSL
jgi:hypothetical protein